MSNQPTLSDELRTSLPRVVQDYIHELEAALSAASGEAAALRTRLDTLETARKTPRKLARWPEGFFERTAGGWQGEPLERGSQGDYEEREPLE
jgi:hypothetical protein